MDENLLASAAILPFQSGFGLEFYPTIADKAACLFFSLAGGHIFSNGNKRTAVLALDQFLSANGVYLVLSNKEVQILAEETASYHERNETQHFAMNRIRGALVDNCVEFRFLRRKNQSLYRKTLRVRKSIIECGGVIAFQGEDSK